MEVDNKRIAELIRTDKNYHYLAEHYRIPILVRIFGTKGMDGRIRNCGKLEESYYKSLFGRQHIYRTTLEWKGKGSNE